MPTDKFEDVALAANVKGQSYFFIESSSFWSLMTTIVMMVIFLLMHTYAAIRAPPALASKTDYFKLNTSEENVSIDVDLTLTGIQDFHRFVAINASLIRPVGANAKKLDGTMNTKKTGLKNFAIVNTDTTDKHPVALGFDEGKTESASFFVDRQDVGGIDQLQVRMTLRTDFTGVTGFRFTWLFANPSSSRYVRSSKLLMSFLAGYMFVVFVFYLKFDVERYSQVWLIVLGAAAVFASNPVSAFLPVAKGLDPILMAVFTAVFRAFILLQFELLRAHAFSSSLILTGVVTALTGAAGAVDATAGFDRTALQGTAESVSDIILSSEKILVGIDVLYVVVGGIWLVLAGVGNSKTGGSSRRVGFLAFSFVVTALMGIVTRVICPLQNIQMYSGVPQMLFGSVHVTLAAITLFLMHSGSGPEYVPVDDDEKNAGSLVLGIEQHSGSDEDEDADEN